MKNVLRIVCVLSLLAPMAYGGGIVTNTNQSAEFIRSLNRNASTDIDAVYYNPAAVANFAPGMHLYLSNQTIYQTRTVTSAFPSLNDGNFPGKTFAPAFPNVYLSLNSGKGAISFGIMPIGGGGSAEYTEGLPSFEYTLAGLARGVPASSLNSQLSPYGNINGYSLDANFTGSSVYIGFQENVSYQITSMISVSSGLRYVYASNTYEGYLRDLTLNTSQNPNGSALGTLTSAEVGALLADREVEAARTGSGITGIVGVNFQPREELNLSFRYETITKLTMVNETDKDDVGLFPDGEKIQSDIPGMIAAGANYQIADALRTEASFTYYFNTGVDWESSEDYVNNGFEAGLAVEYNLSSSLLASVGGLMSRSGATDEYQSDLDYSINSNSLGLGVKYLLSPKMYLSAGYSRTFYEEGQNDKSGNFAETYDKTSDVIAIGFGYDL